MGREIAEIRRDIEASRARLRDTAEAIGWKADVPARARDILRETAGVVRERVAQGHHEGNGHGGGGSDGPSLMQRAKAAMHGVTESVGSATSTVGDKVGSAKETVASTASTVGDKVGSAKESVASTASTVGDKVGSAKESVASTTSSVGERVGAARESVSGGAGTASDAAGSAVGTVKEHMPSGEDARTGARRAASFAKGNPMALAVGALVLGAAAGLAMPSTRTEDERIGPMADDLRERGVERAGEAVQQGREVLAEKGREVAERGQEVVSDVRERAGEAVAPSDGADGAAGADRDGPASWQPARAGSEGVRPADEPVRPVG